MPFKWFSKNRRHNNVPLPSVDEHEIAQEGKNEKGKFIGRKILKIQEFFYF